MEFSLSDIIKSLYRILKCFIYIGSKRVSLPFTIGISGLIIQQIIISILNKIFCSLFIIVQCSLRFISPIYLFHFCRIILQGMMTILKSLKKLEWLLVLLVIAGISPPLALDEPYCLLLNPHGKRVTWTYISPLFLSVHLPSFSFHLPRRNAIVSFLSSD